MEEGRIHEAKKKAMKLLERMDRSELALVERLLQDGFSEQEARAALEYVKSYGYVDDARYAQNYIRANLALKSRAKILDRLFEKGIPQDVAQEAWEAVLEDEEYEEDALIRRAIEKRCPQGIPEDPGELRRLYGYLARRGFSYSDCRRILEEG